MASRRACIGVVPGMIGRPGERHGEPAQSDDGVNDAKRDCEAVEHRPLFDVELQIAKRLIVGPRLGDARRVETVVSDRVA